MSSEPDLISSIGKPAAEHAPQWGHIQIGLPDVWQSTTGDPAIHIAIVDTGVRITHEELSSSVLDPEIHFPTYHLDLDQNDNDVSDGNGHGTYIAGIISSDDSNSIALHGVAPNCLVIPIRIGSNLSVNKELLVEGALLAADLGAKVINYSWASKIPNPLEEEMCRILEEKGVLLVCSAGNEDNDFPWYPAAYGTALSVGSSDALDARVPELCGYGDYIDIAAPGVFLKSCWKDSDDDYVSPGFGNSYATAFVSGAAALLLSEDPTLTPAELRQLLVSSGAPTTGFGEHPVPRLDIAAAFDKLHGLSISAPQLGQLTQSGMLELQPLVIGEADWLSASAHGMELARAGDAPASVTIDTTMLPDGAHELVIRAGNATSTVQCSLPVVIDNSGTGLASFGEDFYTGLNLLCSLPSSGCSDDLLTRLRQFGPMGWDIGDLRSGGGTLWQLLSGAGFQAATQVSGQSGYGAWSTELLVSRRIDLSGRVQPSLSVSAACNLEQDRDFLRFLATTDNGLSFSQLTFEGPELPAALSGLQEMQQYELDLSPFAGESLHVVVMLESDGAGSGEDTHLPGAWIDKALQREGGQAASANSGFIGLQAWQLLGEAAGVPDLQLSLPGATGSDAVHYELDLAPFDNSGSEDIHIESIDTGSSFPASIPLSALGNRIAVLRIIPLKDGNPGAMREIPLWFFSQPGDANADGQVNQADLDFIRTRVGMSSDDPDWTVFADSDLDGLITEADAAAVGYHWGE
ncbi:S8 family serine peptidase [bacterium]|nr:S8 family serine peptidase [bacterium]